MITPKLVANHDTGEGHVRFSPEWNSLDALLRADVLRDWIYELKNAYDEALDSAFGDGGTK